jgi:hypothetical protein
MAKRTGEPITLGSGTFYLSEATDTVPSDIAAVKALCIDANRLGRTKGGATLTYTEETHEEKDDLGYVSKIVTTSEEVLLKGGLLTWTGDTLTKLVDRSKATTASGARVTKIGGAGNAKGKYYVVIFHHADPVDGDLYVVIIGRNTAGLSIVFAVDAGTVLEPEFKAKPQDKDGTLVAIYEETGTAS